MNLALAVGLLAVGAALLVAGTEWFMGSAGALAARWRLSVLAVGFLLAGAEPEELVTGVTAAASGHPTLAAGDVVGANVTMLTLGLGLAALVLPLPMTRVVRSYALLATAAGLLATAALRNLLVGRVEGGVLVTAYAVAVAVVWRNQRTPPLFGEAAEALEEGQQEAHRLPPLVMVLLGLAAMAGGGLAAVDGASRLAAVTGLGERATGLTALALATSIEVLALVTAARRHQLTEVAVVGVFGAVIYNATATLGAAALTRPLVVPDLVLVSVLATVLPALIVLLARGGPVPRWVGGGLVLAYAGFLATTLG